MTIFEKIINNEIPSYKVYEDEKYLVILDAFPKSNGHTLVIPKNKKENILEEDKKTISDIFSLSKKISLKLKEKLKCDGIKWVVNNGKEAGQEIFHTHVHLIPFYKENKEIIEIKKTLNKIIS